MGPLIYPELKTRGVAGEQRIVKSIYDTTFVNTIISKSQYRRYMSGKINEMLNLTLAIESIAVELKYLRIHLENQGFGILLEQVQESLDSIDGTLECFLPMEEEE